MLPWENLLGAREPQSQLNNGLVPMASRESGAQRFYSFGGVEHLSK